MEAVERPKVETQQFQVFTEEQVRTFLAAARGHPFEALFYLALTTSLRKGKLLGLMWSDVDWQKVSLKIERQLQNIPGNGYALVPTKTKSGRRQIKVGKGALAMLEAHRQRQETLKASAGDRWVETGMIFTTNIGTYLDQTRVSREFKQILRENGLPASASTICVTPRSLCCWTWVLR